MISMTLWGRSIHHMDGSFIFKWYLTCIFVCFAPKNNCPFLLIRNKTVEKITKNCLISICLRKKYFVKYLSKKYSTKNSWFFIFQNIQAKKFNRNNFLCHLHTTLTEGVSFFNGANPCEPFTCLFRGRGVLGIVPLVWHNGIANRKTKNEIQYGIFR